MAYQEEIFDEEGHLTASALQTFFQPWQEEEFSQLQRLEIAEHLSFCDHCVLCCTEILTDDRLLTPSDVVVSTVMTELSKRERKRNLHKYASVVIAAGFALLFWVAGVFSLPVPVEEFSQLMPFSGFTNGMEQKMVETTEFTSEISQGISQQLEDFVNYFADFNQKGDFSYGEK